MVGRWLCIVDVVADKGLKTDGPDRYVTFLGIDFEGNMAIVLGHLRRYTDNPRTANAFWDKFKHRLEHRAWQWSRYTDKLLLHYMVELFKITTMRSRCATSRNSKRNVSNFLTKRRKADDQRARCVLAGAFGFTSPAARA